MSEIPLVPPPTKTSDDADGERRPLCEDQGAGGLPFSIASTSSNSSTCDSEAEAVLKQSVGQTNRLLIFRQKIPS